VSIDIAAGRDAGSGVTTLRLTGELTFTTVEEIEVALDRYAGEGPTAVIVDLSALQVASPVVLAVVSGAAERTARQSGVPVLLCCARQEIARVLAVLHPFNHVYSSHRHAIDALTDPVSRWGYWGRPWPVANGRTMPRPIPLPGPVTTVRFSARETEVLRYLATALTLAEIAAAMDVSVNTAKACLRSVFRKLGVSRRRDAVLRADERGLLK
jgi:anti-anti-sigma factor